MGLKCVKMRMIPESDHGFTMIMYNDKKSSIVNYSSFSIFFLLSMLKFKFKLYDMIFRLEVKST